MKLRTKLFLNSFLSILIALVILAYVITNMIQMQSTANTFSNTLLKVEQFNSSMVSFQQSLDNFGKNPTESNHRIVVTKYNEINEKKVILKAIQSTNAEEVKRIGFITEKIKNIDSYMDVIIEEKDNKTIEAIQLSSKILGILNDIYLLNVSLNMQYEDLAKKNNNQILFISIMSGLILLFASSIMSTLITKRIVLPIKQLSTYSQKIASGNLTITNLDIVSKDEIGQLARSFNIMKYNLNELIDRIQNHADELKDKNERINDSISYAKRIQESLLPSNDQLSDILDDYFLIWRPRDVVGGDFYWSYKTTQGFFVAVGDCTGHGVPGALMTTLSISALNNIVEKNENTSPAKILQELNNILKRNLHQNNEAGLTDDGLDIGLCYVEGKKITYAGSKLSLYRKTENSISVFIGDRKSVGYRRTPTNYEFQEVIIEASDENAIFYITTDGYIDQNGGEKDYSFGKKRFVKIIDDSYSLSINEQKTQFISKLESFMGEEPQRDDITILGFSL